MTVLLAAEFPPLSHITNWSPIAGEGLFEINKIVLVYAFAVFLTWLLFFLGGRKKALVPTGAQNLAEIAVEFVEDGIVMETMGEEGRKYTSFLMSLFFFVFFTNIFEVVPVIQMPAAARIAMPLTLAIIAYIVYHGAGFKSHGFFGYWKHALVPPGVPAALLILVVPIEFISKFLVQPFSHTVRLFANLLAGHILLVTFAVLTSALIAPKWYIILAPLPFAGVVFFTAFEVFVSFLQAYVFTLLTGVYINSAQSHEH